MKLNRLNFRQNVFGVRAPSNLGIEQARALSNLGISLDEVGTSFANLKIQQAKARAESELIGRFAQIKNEVEELRGSLLNEPNPDQHEALFTKGFGKIRKAHEKEVMAIGIPDLTNQFANKFKAYEGDQFALEKRRALQMQVNNTVSKNLQTLEDLTQQVSQDDNDHEFISEEERESNRTKKLNDISLLIDSMVSTGQQSPEQGQSLRNRVNSRITRGRVNKLLRENPEAAVQFLESDSAKHLPEDTRQLLLTRAERKIESLRFQRVRAEEKAQKLAEKQLTEEQEEQASFLTLQAEVGDLDVDTLNDALEFNDISRSQYNSIRKMLDEETSGESDPETLAEFQRKIEIHGNKIPESEIWDEERLSPKDKVMLLKAQKRIDLKKDMAEDQNYKNAVKTFNLIFGHPLAPTDKQSAERRGAAWIQFQDRYFEKGEDPLAVVLELGDIEKDIFRNPNKPYAQSRIINSLSNIPEKYHMFREG